MSTASQARLTFINDEVSDSLETGIAFAQNQQLSVLELRSVGGKNLMNYSLPEIQEFANKIHQNGLSVISLATPLLKWCPEGKNPATDSVKSHGYNSLEMSTKEIFAKAFAIADCFQAKYLRIFSYLKYENFHRQDLENDLQQLLELANKYDKILLLENEPVCNIISLASQLELLSYWQHPRLKALVDIGNLYEAGYFVDVIALKNLQPYLAYVHIKDFSLKNGSYVTLGEGSVKYEKYFQIMQKFFQENIIYFSLETHVNVNKLEATESSLSFLKNILTQLQIL